MEPDSISSGFSEEAIEVCAALVGATKGLKRALLRQYLLDFPQDVALFRTKGRLSQPTRYRDQLDDIARYSSRLATGEPGATTVGLVKRLATLNEQSTRMLRYDAAERVAPDRHEDLLQSGEADGILERLAREDPAALTAAAATARDDIAKRATPGRGGVRDQADWALNQTLLLLISHWIALTHRQPGIAFDFKSRKPSGKFVEFVQICLREVGWNLTLEGIRHRFQRLKKTACKRHLISEAEHRVYFRTTIDLAISRRP